MRLPCVISPEFRPRMISTRECNLLNLDFIRADEVWFVEKNKAGACRDRMRD